jgi:hypothetical protein
VFLAGVSTKELLVSTITKQKAFTAINKKEFFVEINLFTTINKPKPKPSLIETVDG